MDSFCHPRFTTTNRSYRFPIFETSATALCGTTGIYIIYIYIYIHTHTYAQPPKLEKELGTFGWKGRQRFKKSKVKKYTFRLFDFSSSLSPFRLFGFSSSLSTLNGLSFVLLAAHVQLERHPAKNQTVKMWKVKKYTFRHFDFSKCKATPFQFSFHFSTFRNWFCLGPTQNPTPFQNFNA